MKKISAKKKVKLINKWSKWFYSQTETFQHRLLGWELAYLYAAICSDDYVDWDRESETVRILEANNISKKNKIWNYIKID